MLQVSMLDFLQTGIFGPVRFGMTREELQAALGPPDMIGASNYKFQKGRPGFFTYGVFEFHFDFDLPIEPLCLIFVDELQEHPKLHGGAAFSVDPWILAADLTADTLVKELRRLGTVVEAGPCEPEPDDVCVTTGPGVRVVFVLKEKEHSAPIGLYSIYRAAPGSLTG